MTKDDALKHLEAELLAASRRCWRPWHWRVFGRRIVPAGEALAALATAMYDAEHGDD